MKFTQDLASWKVPIDFGHKRSKVVPTAAILDSFCLPSACFVNFLFSLSLSKTSLLEWNTIKSVSQPMSVIFCHQMPDFFQVKCTKFNFSWGCAADPTGRAYSTPLDSLAHGRGWLPPPQELYPHFRPFVPRFSALRASIMLQPPQTLLPDPTNECSLNVVLFNCQVCVHCRQRNTQHAVSEQQRCSNSWQFTSRCTHSCTVVHTWSWYRTVCRMPLWSGPFSISSC